MASLDSGNDANGSTVPTTTLTSALKNERTKRILHVTGIRRRSLTQRRTPHYRMPKVVANGGYLLLKKYDGPEIPTSEYEDLVYTTYASDASDDAGADHVGHRRDRAAVDSRRMAGPTSTASGPTTPRSAPRSSAGSSRSARGYGRVQLLKMQPNTLRECRWGLHLDNNNAVNRPGQERLGRAGVARADRRRVERARRPQPSVRQELGDQDCAARATSRRWSTPSCCTTAATTKVRARATR